MTKKIIGIDLGTTNSCVAVMDGAEVKVLENDEGNRTTPSVVAEKMNKDGSIEIIVGNAAIRGAANNSKYTYSVIKRFIGRELSEVEEKEKKNITYDLVSGKENRVEIKGRKGFLTPEQIGGHVLKKLKNFAENKLSTKIEDAVITVPAYFNNKQRQATKEAGEIAGLNVLRVINEPTAAALAYGFEKKKNGKILVYDLGGGTFDVSILTIEEGVFETLATKGDTVLGGEDFDNLIVQLFLDEFKNEHGIDLNKDPSALLRIKEAAEGAKKILSNTEQTEINLPYIYQTKEGPLNFHSTLTRAKLNQMVDKLVQKTLKIVDEALTDAKLTVKDIDEILLVGGQTRSPIIFESIKKHLGKEPNKSVNPDEAVAIGAAIQGAILSGESNVKDLLLLDVTPLSLGIETLGGVMTVLIPRNTTVPIEKTQVFSTAEDNQTSVTVAIYQGERSMARDNKSLGQFELSGIAPGKRGIPQIEITFSINSNGILEVKAMDKNTKKEHKLTVTNSGGLSKEEVEKMREEAEKYAEEDKKKKLLIEVHNHLEQSVYSGEKNLEEFKDKISETLQTELKQEIEKGKDLLKNSPDDMEKLEEQAKNLQNTISKIGEEMNKQSQQEQQTPTEPENGSSADSSKE